MDVHHHSDYVPDPHIFMFGVDERDECGFAIHAQLRLVKVLTAVELVIDSDDALYALVRETGQALEAAWEQGEDISGDRSVEGDTPREQV